MFNQKVKYKSSNFSPKKYYIYVMKKFKIVIILLCVINFWLSAEGNKPNNGKFSNIVVFVTFANDEEFPNNYSYYDSIFNSSTGASLYDYYKEISYNKLEVASYFLRKDTIISYKDKYSRNYYLQNSSSNNIGFVNANEAAERKSVLLKEICSFIQKSISNNVDVDLDNNGIVDNITIILKGTSEPNNTIMWPHQNSVSSGNYGFQAYINDKQVRNYIIMLSEAFNLGTLCHEFFHTLGATDLYRSDRAVTPLYYWDLMDLEYLRPQHPSAYMKYRYGKWIDTIPNITLYGEYYLNPSTNKDTNCYAINTNIDNEYLVLEYRKPTGKYESSLRSMHNRETNRYVQNDGGLLIYRVNKTKAGEGNINANATMSDEIYCYRPDGTNNQNGKPWNALFNSRYGRNKFNQNTNPAPVRFNGSLMNVAITDIYESNGKLFFSYRTPNTTFIKYPVSFEANVSLKPVIKWDLLENNRNYSVQISTNANFDILAVDDVIINDSLCYVKTELQPNTIYYVRVGALENTSVSWSRVMTFITTKNIAIQTSLSQYCAGDSAEIYYDYLGNFNNIVNLNIYLLAQDDIIKAPMLLKNTTIDKVGKIVIPLPKNLPTGYKYRLLFQETNDTSSKVTTNLFRVKGFPEVIINTNDTTLTKNSITTFSFTDIDSNVQYIDYTYSWKVKKGTIQNINDTNNSITILWDTAGEGEVTLIAINDIDCTDEYSKKVNVIDIPKIQFNTKDIVCANMPISYYLVGNYHNDVIRKIEVINGNFETKKDSIIITWDNVDTGYVRIISSIGAISDTTSATQIISKMPDITIIGNDAFCSNDTAEYTLNIDNPSDFDVKWSAFDANWNCINANIISENNQHNCSIIANNDTIILTIKITNKTTNCEATTSKIIAIYDAPDIPIISFEAGVLVCNLVAAKYIWLHNDSIIANSNLQAIIPVDTGNYYVIVENNEGCKRKSEPFHLNVGVKEISPDVNIIKHDDNTIYIQFAEEKDNVIAELYDLSGSKLVTIHRKNTDKIALNISEYANSIYILRIFASHQTFYQIIIKD